MFIVNPDRMFLIYELRKKQTNELVMEGTLESIFKEIYRKRYIVENIGKWFGQLRLNWRKYV